MAELLTARHPLERWRGALDELSRELGDELRVELEPTPAAVDLRLPASGAALRAAADVLGGALPVAPRAWNARPDGARVHRLGPDQWLITSDDRDGIAAIRESTLREALRQHGGTATDVSAGLIALRVTGVRTRELLSFGCSLDLRRRALAPGSCAQTVVWQSPTLLVVDDDGLRLLVRTSFASHLVARLLDAAHAL